LLPHQFARPSDTVREGPVVPDGHQQFTVQLQSQRALGGAIAAGDRVGMFLSFTPGVAPSYMTHLRLDNVLVTAVRSAAGDTPTAETAPPDGDTAAVAAGSASAEPSAAEPGVDLYVTFATTAADAEVAIFAAEFGTIWLSDAPAGSEGSSPPGVTSPDVHGTATSGGTP
jgi:pilus assembly protein CpaB